MTRLLTVVTGVVFCSIALRAQTYFKVFNGSEDIRPTAIINTSDGGYAIAGHTESYGAGEVDVYLIRTDGTGDTLWVRTYGQAQSEVAHSLAQLSDGGFLIGGGGRFGSPYYHGFLLRTASNGDHVWTKTYVGDLVQFPTLVLGLSLTPDGGAVLTGSYGPSGDPQLIVIRTSSLGDTLWSRLFDWGDESEGTSIATVPGGGSIVTGQVFSSPTTHLGMVRLDDFGSVLWSRVYDGLGRGAEVVPTTDGGFVIVGNLISTSYLLKTDGNGLVQWARTYNSGMGNSAYGDDVRETSDGGFVMAGVWDQKPWLVRTDDQGAVLWMNTYDDTYFGESHVVANTDGGFTMTALGEGTAVAPLVLLRTDADGYVPCFQSEITNPGGSSQIPTELILPITSVSFGTATVETSLVGTGASIVTYCSTVDVPEGTLEGAISFYPNPAADALVISLPEHMRLADYTIHDVCGRVVQRGMFSGSQDRVQLGTLVPGSYGLRVGGHWAGHFVKE